MHWHIYAYIAICSSGLRLIGLEKVPNKAADTLAAVNAKIIHKLEEYSINLSGFVSDNDAALIASFASSRYKDVLTLKCLLGSALYRVACACHTSQLSIQLLYSSSPEFAAFADSVTATIRWINAKANDFKNFCPYKVPQFIATRWNTLEGCAKFLLRNSTQVNNFISQVVLKERAEYDAAMEKFINKKTPKEPNPPIPPPIEDVPATWQMFYAPLKVLTDFTNRVEGVRYNLGFSMSGI